MYADAGLEEGVGPLFKMLRYDIFGALCLVVVSEKISQKK